MNTKTKQTIKGIIGTFENLNGASFVGIKGYTSKSTGEVSNHVVNANFSYGNAVEKDLKKLQGATEKDIKAISEKGFSIELVNTAIAKLTQSFIKNQSKETASNQSKAQSDSYVKITNSIRLHLETGKISIYALSVSKDVIVKGEYKTVNSRELTKCQNAVKKHFNFTTAKFRNFLVNDEQLTGVNISGEQYKLK